MQEKIGRQSRLVREGGHMTERTNGHGMYPWGRLVLFVLFLIFLAIVLKAMGWCVGGVCDVGLDALLK